MGIENIRWWMWVIISIPVGWLLGLVNSSPIEPTDMRTDEQVYFERQVMTAPQMATDGQSYPLMRNMVVYPPASGLAMGGGTVQIMPVTYEALILVQGGRGEREWQPCWFGAPVPYTPSRAQGPVGSGGMPPGIDKSVVPERDGTLGSIAAEYYGKDTPDGEAAIAKCNPVFSTSTSVADLMKRGKLRATSRILIPWNPVGKTIQDWLDAAGKKYNWVNYKYAWWKEEKKCKELWMGISVGVIGVIWPITIAFLTGAGLSGRRVKESDYDLSKFGTGKATAVPSLSPKGGLGEEGKEQLAAMNEALTASVAKDAVDGSVAAKPAATPAGPAAPPAKTLVAETLAAPGEEQKTSKDYAGEFYPVAKPGDKGDGEEKPKK